jgi:hypothetical protein
MSTGSAATDTGTMASPFPSFPSRVTITKSDRQLDQSHILDNRSLSRISLLPTANISLTASSHLDHHVLLTITLNILLIKHPPTSERSYPSLEPTARLLLRRRPFAARPGRQRDGVCLLEQRQEEAQAEPVLRRW